MTCLKHSPMPWSYEYNPYRVRREPDGIESELPAFEVFDNDGDKVFDTNEDTPAERQEANALVAVTASEMAEVLQAFIQTDTLATECGEWKWEHLEPLFQRARELIARITT